MGEEVFQKPKKRALSQKQLDALAQGRARAKEKRMQKAEMDKMEKEAVVKRKEQRSFARDVRKEQAILEKIKIREREEKKRSDIQKRQKKWEEARLAALDKCRNVKEYETVSKILDQVDFDDILKDNGVEQKLSKYLALPIGDGGDQ